MHQPFQPACRRGGVVEGKAEYGGARLRAGIVHEAAGGMLPAGGQNRVGVQEQQPIACRRLGAGAKLAAAAWRATDDARAAAGGDGKGGVGGAAVGDDDLGLDTALTEARDGIGETAAGIQGGDNDAQHGTIIRPAAGPSKLNMFW